jgi:hypothetical protein
MHETLGSIPGNTHAHTEVEWSKCQGPGASLGFPKEAWGQVTSQGCSHLNPFGSVTIARDQKGIILYVSNPWRHASKMERGTDKGGGSGLPRTRAGNNDVVPSSTVLLPQSNINKVELQ